MESSFIDSKGKFILVDRKKERKLNVVGNRIFFWIGKKFGTIRKKLRNFSSALGKNKEISMKIRKN